MNLIRWVLHTLLGISTLPGQRLRLLEAFLRTSVLKWSSLKTDMLNYIPLEFRIPKTILKGHAPLLLQ